MAKNEPHKPILLLACGALAREVLALIEMNDWHHMELKCLPAQYHLYPDKIPVAVEEMVVKHRNDYDKIFVLYADCGTGGQLQSLCKKLNVEMLSGPHCYSFFDGNEMFIKRQEDEFTAFFLTDFLVKQFDAFVWRPMGLDKHPELRDMLFGNYKKLIYLAQIDDPKLDKMAAEQAERLGLVYERRVTGYGDLEKEMAIFTAS